MTPQEKAEVRALAAEWEYARGFFEGFFKATKRELWMGNPFTLQWVESDAFIEWCEGWSVFPLEPSYLRKLLLAEWCRPPWKETDE